MKQRKLILLTMVLLTILLSACSAADTVSHNISKDSDEFRVIRRVVFYNSLTDTYIMEMVGNISVDLDRDNVIEVIAKVGPDKYQKHYLGLSDNVTYTVEQLRTSDVSEYDYKMIFKPEKIIPIDIEYKTGEEEME
ncbi:hypothetical protein SAMN05421839_10627 [Halolactibacillus halophilus]|uniref:Uncharacterized protein n=1 Tax=Halolactibacillus halophilus TaxID=306540 RepID=A0A1I5MN48_9BACI|nr:hypothetical protein [Halolactibacillus halophilus]GEM02519.1 hypothetical protein HHA03_20510 [Halolactibacillus halophilus]SFP10989.1 hypothetical protein SAMN05421839_10627 [Halolactibacillus halophilus]